MKNVFLGCSILLCSVIFLVIVMTVSGTNLRQNELNRAVDSAIEDTVKNLSEDRSIYTVNSQEECIADFTEALLVQINSDCSITVNILEADYEKGLLSVQIIEMYTHPVGTEGKVSAERTVIMEET